mmetsp:Transcript_11580/g.17363  ORF Transcript_11580/g.17363 Transcript_11580/m.17363 type:complete len:484 (-) Transcript_11580:159-1610(-)|eukprot:CAMPEP_0201549222 /NCGR_PEP_ID=MMETSP0173_2-20130828/5713_1 /ASSEMBLY_ACC=CAM_ASM_000268 /TAXON_ID=218659 /ORGANISM="Vexillifera sp., Strain DIVA3 564/2" /LENGTH=483 /DNA_ID=CAMNT_0047958825 /DNA_START=71 /DNA_END=1522 /DNA_ORIENTATION=-
MSNNLFEPGKINLTFAAFPQLNGDEREKAIEQEIKEIRKLHESHVFIQFNQQRNVGDKLIPFHKGSGSFFFDLRGKTYLDFGAQLFNLQLGHQHPGVVGAVQEQASKACYIRPTVNCFRQRGELAKRLAAYANLEKVLFTTAGSDAVDYAIKVAKMVTGREKVCAAYRSYHGATILAKSLAGDPKTWAGGNELGGVYRFHNPYPYRCPFGYPEGNVDVYVKHVIDTIEYEGPHLTAAFIMETIPGSAGMILPPPGDFLKRVTDYCRSKGIIVILDEVMTGFGRSGTMFAYSQFDARPDIVTVAKGISNGAVPLGALITSKEIAQHFDERIFYAGLTYSAHPLAVAAASATLDAFEKENILQRCQQSGQVLSELLTKLKENLPQIVGDVRSIGLLGVIEVVTNAKTREALKDEKVLQSMKQYFHEKGLYLFFRWHYMLIVPPLNIEQDHLKMGVTIIENCLKAHQEKILATTSDSMASTSTTSN